MWQHVVVGMQRQQQVHTKQPLPCAVFLQVSLKTTLGDIDVELWPKEAPKVSCSAVLLL